MSDNITPVQKAERLQRRRIRLMTAQAVLFIVWQASFFASSPDMEGPRRSVEIVKMSSFMVWAGLLLLLIATGGNWWQSHRMRDLVNDEVTRAHFRSAQVWGYWAAMLACFGLYVISFFEPIRLLESLHIVLSAGIATPLVRFVFLERRSDAAE